jgi:hypothetical protein
MSGLVQVDQRDIVPCALCGQHAHRPLEVRLARTPNLCDGCERALLAPGDPTVAKKYRARVARRALRAKRKSEATA